MSQNEMIKEFMAYARCSREYACTWLKHYDWNYEQAVDAYWRFVILMGDADD